MFLSCRPFVVNATFLADLVGVEEETEVTSTPTRHVENVVFTTKRLQDRKIQSNKGGK